jgi:large subunit ribosomal protein L32
MAVPKRKWSKARTGKRKSQWKLKAPTLVSCPQCHKLTAPHRVCMECGYYSGKSVIEVDKAKKQRT